MSEANTSGQPMFTIDQISGYSRLVSTEGEDERGNKLLGGYAIYYDRNGRETGRSENVWHVRVGFNV
jgi:hypothetical protein